MAGGGGAAGDRLDGTVVVRRAGAQDVRFLRDMLHHAYYWRERRPSEGPGPVQLYVKGFGRRGDAGVIALVDGFPVGAAWYRLFTARQPGFGFVDERTPELAIAVVPAKRGRGIGDTLLDALFAQARSDGHEALSLYVDRDNQAAIGVYRRHGFEPLREDEDSLVMRAQVA